MQIDRSLLATCLFFSLSPVLRHRSWVKNQLDTNPDIAGIPDFYKWTLEFSDSSVAETSVRPVIPDGIIMHEALSRMIQCNERAEMLLG